MTQAKKWQAPSMSADPNQVIRNRPPEPKVAAPATDTGIPTAKDIEQWRKDAEAEGYQDGLKKASKESLQVQQRLLQLITFFEHPLKSLNEEIEQQLTQVAVTLAQHLVKRELKLDPGEIIGLIRDSIQLLPGNARGIKIYLHPEDVSLVRNALSIEADNDEQSWKLIEDPMITRGGCQIKSDSSSINATLEHRLSALAASVLGARREED